MDNRPVPTFARLTLPIPSPDGLVRLARGAVGWSLDTAVFVVALPARLEALLTDVERLMVRVSVVVDGAAATTARAGDVVDGAGAASAAAQKMIADLEPLSAKAMPLGQKFVDNFSEAELAAAIQMVDHLPELLQRMEGLMPILETMDTIAPEIHQLLEVTTDVRKAVIGIPGFKFFRNRGSDKGTDGVD